MIYIVLFVSDSAIMALCDSSFMIVLFVLLCCSVCLVCLGCWSLVFASVCAVVIVWLLA